MNREDIIRMALKVGAAQVQEQNLEAEYRFTVEAIERLLAVEREACAHICDELHWPWHMGDNSGPKECAEAIRARGTQ